MKKLVITLAVLFTVSLVPAQEKSVLQEELSHTTSKYLKQTMEPNVFNYVLKEKETEEFLKDPVIFVRDNFKTDEFIRLSKKNKYENFEVTFSCDKGYLRARYSRNGKLTTMFQVFRNVTIPRSIMYQIYKDYKGWTVVKVKYIEKGNFDRTDISFYKINLQKGRKVKKVKIYPLDIDSGLVAH